MEQAVTNTRVLTFDQACALLGLSKSYVYKLTSAGKIPFSKPTRRKLYFDREKLEAWMLSNANITEIERKETAATYVATH